MCPDSRALDPLRPRRILTTRLDNAPRAGAPRIRVDARPHAARPGHVEVRVADDGTGIPSEIADRLFAAWESGTGDARSRGLGLFVSRAGARSMGGDLELRSTGIAGTTFSLVLRGPEAP